VENRKTKKYNTDMPRSIGKQSGKSGEEKKGYDGKDLQKKEF